MQDLRFWVGSLQQIKKNNLLRHFGLCLPIDTSRLILWQFCRFVGSWRDGLLDAHRQSCILSYKQAVDHEKYQKRIFFFNTERTYIHLTSAKNSSDIYKQDLTEIWEEIVEYYWSIDWSFDGKFLENYRYPKSQPKMIWYYRFLLWSIVISVYQS